MELLSVDKAADDLRGISPVRVIRESTYRDCSTVIITPTRGAIHWKVVRSWMDLVKPINTFTARLLCEGAEVGDAYNKMIAATLKDPRLAKCKYILTLEDDNIIPADAHMQLLDSIGDYDAIGVMYARKGDGVPLAIGDPTIAYDDCSTRPVTNGLMEVNVLYMGCTLYKMDLFRQMQAPWFQTVQMCAVENDGTLINEHRTTQDVTFSQRARMMGKKFALDCSLRAGHIDIETGVIW